VAEFVERQSAKIPGRPVFNEMLRRVEAGEAQGIVSWQPVVGTVERKRVHGALVKLNETLSKVSFFVLAPYSDAFFVQAFERECTETFWTGHVSAFEFFGGVPHTITGDNTRVAVSFLTDANPPITSRNWLRRRKTWRGV